MKALGLIDWICLILVIIGGLNWGLVGLMHFNLVEMLFGDMMLLARVVYVLVGLAALYLAVIATKIRKAE